MTIAKNRDVWRELWESYVQRWTAIGYSEILLETRNINFVIIHMSIINEKPYCDAEMAHSQRILCNTFIGFKPFHLVSWKNTDDVIV